MSEKYLGENSTPILINQIKENCTQKRSTLPIASVDELGNTYQYVGTTSGSLVHGYFYECVSDEQDPTIYSWQNVNVQPTAGNPTAETTTFDNTTSGLQATNVQGAIDEVDATVDGLSTDVGNIQDVVPSTATSSNKLVDHDSLGTAAFKDSTDRVQPNSTNLVESRSVYSAIQTALSSIYTPRGDITCAELTSSLLISDNIGNVYETSDSGTTTALFLQGAGHPIAVGNNVGIINAGEGRILFNLMANAFDLTDYQKKDLANTIEGATTVEGALGALSANKQDSLTFDNVPTANSNNPVKSNGLYAANQNIYEVIGKMGAKNLIPYPHDAKTETKAGITFTENADGSITVNGTATDIARHLVTSKQFKAGEKYILSGCPSGGAHSPNGTYTLYTQTINNFDDGEGVEFTWNASITGITIAVYTGVTVDNLTFYPMLRLASDTDNTYQPYAKTNQQLTQDKAEQAEVNDIVNVLGAKNLLPLTKRTGGTQNGVTFTVNDNGSITVNGTATSGIGQNEGINKIFYGVIPKGEYLISCKKDKTTSVKAYYALNGGSTATSVEQDSVLSLDNDSTLDMWIYVANTAVLDNVTFYPMLRLASMEDDTYQPYAKTNQELTVANQTLTNRVKGNWFEGGKNKLPNNIYGTTTNNGVTVSRNDDGSLNISGTNTYSNVISISLSDAVWGSNTGGELWLIDDYLDRTKTYIMSISETNVNVRMRLTFYDASKQVISDASIETRTHENITIPSEAVYAIVRLAISQGATVQANTVVYPMLRLASDPDNTYVPYAMTNRELTDVIPSDASASNKLVTWTQSGAILPLVNLGTEYTAELKADISSGKFEKAVVGGYLTINGHVYYLAHPDYWLHTGDTECTTHHMLVIPAGNIGTGKMNGSNITTGGYAGSDFKTGNNSNTALATARAQIVADFGASNILTHRELFTNAVTDGKASNWAWADSNIDLMNEVMVYGYNAWALHSGYETGIDKCQIKLFQERPDLITTRSHWWLRSVVSAVAFAVVAADGAATGNGASNALGVRPAFAIIG